MNSLSTFLYARPSFGEGVARLIDFGNTLQEYNTSITGDQADTLAIASDWLVVGDDLKNVMFEYKDLEDELISKAEKYLNLSV